MMVSMLLWRRRARPTLRELFARRGFTLDLSAFEGLTVSGSNCVPFLCKHGPGKMPALKIVKMGLGMRHVTYACDAMGEHPELRAFHEICEKVFDSQAGVNKLLESSIFEWQADWEIVLLPHRSGLSFKEVNDAWLRNRIATEASAVLECLEASSGLKGGWTVPLQSVSPEPLVLVKPFLERQPVTGQEVFELMFGPSGMPGVLQVPERFVREMSSTDPAWRAVTNYAYHYEPEGEESVWLLGGVLVSEPVKVLDSYTATVREVAGVLMENMSLKAAFDAALEV